MSFVYFPPARKSPVSYLTFHLLEAGSLIFWQIVDFDKHELAAVIRGTFPSEIAELASNFIIVLNVSGRQFLELDDKKLLTWVEQKLIEFLATCIDIRMQSGE